MEFLRSCFGFSKGPARSRKMSIRVYCLTFIILVLTSSCYYHFTSTAEVGAPIDQDTVNQIVIGKTTKSEIFKLFGTPHSIFQGQVEFLKAEMTGFYSQVENRFLTSLDEKHYAMFYRFGKSSGKFTLASIFVITRGDTQVKIRSDELLLLFNKETNIVEDVAYRKQT